MLLKMKTEKAVIGFAALHFFSNNYTRKIEKRFFFYKDKIWSSSINKQLTALFVQLIFHKKSTICCKRKIESVYKHIQVLSFFFQNVSAKTTKKKCQNKTILCALNCQ